MKKKKTIGIGRFVFNIPVALILIIIAMMVLVPVVWVTLSAFKTEKDIISWPPTFIPKTFTLENFVDVQGRIDIIRYIMNSVIYAGATTALAVIVNSMAGYAYAFYDFKGKTASFLMTLATMMVPFQVIMVPLFLVVYKMGMYDTYWGLIIPRVAVAGSIFMMRAAFTGIPKEMAEAARIDGLTEFGIFWKIMLPQVKPAVITLVILSVNGSWNDLLWPMIVTSSTEMRTLANGLALFIGQNTIEYAKGIVMKTMSDGPAYSCKEFPKVSYIDSLSVWNKEENELVFFAVNRDEFSKQVISLQLSDFVSEKVIESISMTADDKKMTNQYNHEAVKPKTVNNAKINNQEVKIELEPLSFNMVRIKIK